MRCRTEGVWVLAGYEARWSVLVKARGLRDKLKYIQGIYGGLEDSGGNYLMRGRHLGLGTSESRQARPLGREDRGEKRAWRTTASLRIASHPARTRRKLDVTFTVRREVTGTETETETGTETEKERVREHGARRGEEWRS